MWGTQHESMACIIILTSSLRSSSPPSSSSLSPRYHLAARTTIPLSYVSVAAFQSHRRICRYPIARSSGRSVATPRTQALKESSAATLRGSSWHAHAHRKTPNPHFYTVIIELNSASFSLPCDTMFDHWLAGTRFIRHHHQ